MPISKIPSERSISDKGHQANSKILSAAALVRWAYPRSAQRPARPAASAPTAPASPNAPIAVCEKLNGGALSGSTSALQKMLNDANISSASTPRICSTFSCRSSVSIEPINRG